MKTKTLTGANLSIYINGKLFGICESFSYTIDTGRKEIRGIDSLFPFELAPTQVAVTGQMSVFRTANTAGLEGLGIAARDFVLPRERYFSITVIDRSTDSTPFKTDMAAVRHQNWDVAAQGLMRGTFSFVASGYANDF